MKLSKLKRVNDWMSELNPLTYSTDYETNSIVCV